jgi:pimeloyl-ACP methyl ester carboxylesterase
MAAQALALAHPHRVAALVLVGTGAGWGALPRRLRLLSSFHGCVPRRPFPEIFSFFMAPPGKHADAGLRDDLRRQMRHRTKAHVGECLRAMRSFDPRPGLAALKIPTLVGRELAAAIPGARLMEIPDAGHLPHATHTAAFAEAVTAFLGEAGA